MDSPLPGLPLPGHVIPGKRSEVLVASCVLGRLPCLTLVTGAGGLPDHGRGVGSPLKERSSPAALPLAQLSLPLARHGAVALWVWLFALPVVWFPNGLFPSARRGAAGRALSLTAARHYK